MNSNTLSDRAFPRVRFARALGCDGFRIMNSRSGDGEKYIACKFYMNDHPSKVLATITRRYETSSEIAPIVETMTDALVEYRYIAPKDKQAQTRETIKECERNDPHLEAGQQRTLASHKAAEDLAKEVALSQAHIHLPGKYDDGYATLCNEIFSVKKAPKRYKLAKHDNYALLILKQEDGTLIKAIEITSQTEQQLQNLIRRIPQCMSDMEIKPDMPLSQLDGPVVEYSRLCHGQEKPLPIYKRALREPRVTPDLHPDQQALQDYYLNTQEKGPQR